MKIRLALLDTDSRYIRKLSSYFNTYYADKLEIYGFSNDESLSDFLKKKKIDVLLVNQQLMRDEFANQRNMQYAYFSENIDIDTINDITAVCKYQKADLIYKEVLNLFSELDSSIGYKSDGSLSHLVAFMGVTGGVGTSVSAVGFARYLALSGSKVLYLDLEENGCCDQFFDGNKGGSLSEILNSLKRRRSNLNLKLESQIQQDSSGICYYLPFQATLDMQEMSKDELKQLLHILSTSGNYDVIVIDTDPNISELRNLIIDEADDLILVSDGSETANWKMEKRLQEFHIMDEMNDSRIAMKTRVLYARFGSASKAVKTQYGEQMVGQISKFGYSSLSQLIKNVADTEVMKAIAGR